MLNRSRSVVTTAKPLAFRETSRFTSERFVPMTLWALPELSGLRTEL